MHSAVVFRLCGTHAMLIILPCQSVRVICVEACKP